MHRRFPFQGSHVAAVIHLLQHAAIYSSRSPYKSHLCRLCLKSDILANCFPGAADLQSDLKVTLSAPSAPSLPSFVDASQAYSLGSIDSAQHVNPFVRHSNSNSEMGRHVDGRPPLPNQAVHKGQPFAGLGFGANQVALTKTSRDRNAVV